jgi:hypothetical protein
LDWDRADGGGWSLRTAAAGVCGRRRDNGPQQRWAAELAGGSPAHARMHSRAPNLTGRAPKGRGRLEELTGDLGREVEAPAEEIDSEGGRRGSGSGEASGSARASKERGGSGAGGLGDGALLVYRAEGQAGGRISGGRRAHRRPPLRLGGDLGARPLREGEEGEGAGRRRVSARRTKGEGEEAAGQRGQGGRGGGLGRPKVEERPDRWAPPVSQREGG